jgi:hypothetical protein
MHALDVAAAHPRRKGLAQTPTRGHSRSVIALLYSLLLGFRSSQAALAG